jgi:hypothetical protein
MSRFNICLHGDLEALEQLTGGDAEPLDHNELQAVVCNLIARLAAAERKQRTTGPDTEA